MIRRPLAERQNPGNTRKRGERIIKGPKTGYGNQVNERVKLNI